MRLGAAHRQVERAVLVATDHHDDPEHWFRAAARTLNRSIDSTAVTGLAAADRSLTELEDSSAACGNAGAAPARYARRHGTGHGRLVARAGQDLRDPINKRFAGRFRHAWQQSTSSLSGG
jgi:hypothetical protein